MVENSNNLFICFDTHHECAETGAAGFKNVDAQPVGSGASLRETIRNIDNYFAIG